MISRYPPMTSNDDKASKILWRHVMARAIIDAGTAITEKMETSDVLEILGAREWFRKANRDFHEVCDYAELDPFSAKKKAAKKIELAEKKDNQLNQTLVNYAQAKQQERV